MLDTYPFNLPDLPYEYGALGDRISADIMKLHHDKHHRAYVDKLNEAVAKTPSLGSLSLIDLLKGINDVPSSVQTTIRNNGGGHYNHSIFWRVMSPEGGGEPTGKLADEIARMYGSYQNFVDIFSEKAMSIFGSGWVWLQPDLTVVTTANQDSPLMEGGAEPLLGLDVWEHAYYLGYQNRRADYVKAWWGVVNWRYVEERLGRDT